MPASPPGSKGYAANPIIGCITVGGRTPYVQQRRLEGDPDRRLYPSQWLRYGDGDVTARAAAPTSTRCLPARCRPATATTPPGRRGFDRQHGLRTAHAQQDLQPGNHHCGGGFDPYHHLDQRQQHSRQLTAALTDTLPSGVVVAATPNASITSGGSKAMPPKPHYWLHHRRREDAYVQQRRLEGDPDRRLYPSQWLRYGDGGRNRACGRHLHHTLSAGALQTSNGNNTARPSRL